MRKENVFMVSVRQLDAAGYPCGQVVSYVVCGLNEASVRSYLAESMPGFVILSAVNLVMLEAVIKKIKESLLLD